MLKFCRKFILFILFCNLISSDASEDDVDIVKIYKCGNDNVTPKEITSDNVVPLPKNYRRALDVDEDGYKEMNIVLDLVNFDYEINQYGLQARRQLFINGMNKAIKTLKSLVRIKPMEKNLYLSDQNLRDMEITRYNTTLINEMKSIGMKALGIDLVIFIKFGDSKELGEYTLSAGGTKAIDGVNGQSVGGVVLLNRDVNYTKLNSDSYFESIIIHEFTHILGFSYYLMDHYYHNIVTKKDKFGIQRTYVKSPKVVQTARKYFNCDKIDGVELENIGGSHWEARILLGEYMNGVMYTPEQVISEFTLAALEDTGFYKANYYTGGLMQYGKNKGCDFVFEKCVNDGTVNPKFTNEFYDNIDYFEHYDPSCSSGRMSRAYHVFYLHKTIPDEYKYFTSYITHGEKYWIAGWGASDYCPVSVDSDLDNEDAYYIGSCSGKGKDEYGQRVWYGYNKKWIVYTSGELKDKIGERYSSRSFCVLSNLIYSNVKDKDKYFQYRGVCYEMYCSDRSLTIGINEDFLVCPRAGGLINAIGFDGTLACPDYNLICSGSEICNDMFDCVEKKSLLKEVEYDYVPKTTQDISTLEIEDISEDAYELSENGICPLNCTQCNPFIQCIRCRKNNGILELIAGKDTMRICKPFEELNTGYYKDPDSIYHECIDYCDKCVNGDECETCNIKAVMQNKKCYKKVEHCIEYNEESGKCQNCKKGYKVEGNECIISIPFCIELNDDGTCKTCMDGYVLLNNQCLEKIEHCKDYNNDGNCTLCEDGFAFEKENRRECKNKNEFQEYYTKDEGISYYPCTEDVNNCKKCTYEKENNKAKCNQCQNDYIIIDDDDYTCNLKSNYDDYGNKTYYEVDDYHWRSCSKAIDYCDKCEKGKNGLICLNCKPHYYFLDEVYTECKLKDSIPEGYYCNELECYSCQKKIKLIIVINVQMEKVVLNVQRDTHSEMEKQMNVLI